MAWASASALAPRALVRARASAPRPPRALQPARSRRRVVAFAASSDPAGGPSPARPTSDPGRTPAPPPPLVDPLRATTPSRRRVCSGCGGTGAAPCRTCRGAGALNPGGFHAKNHVDARTVVGTNWTAHERTLGWRHFEAIEAAPARRDPRGGRKAEASVRLAATCDRDVTLWVPARELKDRARWSAGWKQREDLEWSGDADDPRGAVASPKRGPPCPACDGEGIVPCARKGCEDGAERIARQAAIVEEAEKKLRARRAALKERADAGDERAKAEMRSLKAALKATTEGKRGRRKKKTRAARRREEEEEDAIGGARNGEEDWGAHRRARRDARLEAWLRGVGEEERGERGRQ